MFNHSIALQCRDYVHRIGRTGRAGASGLAVTLVSGSDARLVGDTLKSSSEDRAGSYRNTTMTAPRAISATAAHGAEGADRTTAQRRLCHRRGRREPRNEPRGAANPRDYRGFPPCRGVA